MWAILSTFVRTFTHRQKTDRHAQPAHSHMGRQPFHPDHRRFRHKMVQPLFRCGHLPYRLLDHALILQKRGPADRDAGLASDSTLHRDHRRSPAGALPVLRRGILPVPSMEDTDDQGRRPGLARRSYRRTAGHVVVRAQIRQEIRLRIYPDHRPPRYSRLFRRHDDPPGQPHEL